MAFLSSIYLWLIPLSTLPLLIHLFYNRKYHLIEFSSIKFLKDLEIDSMKRIHIIELLLLLIRTLIILFLILMLSRPVFKSESFESYFKSTKSLYCVIALDDSFSMTRSDKSIYLRDLFSDKIEAIVKTLPSKAHLSIMKISNERIIFNGLKEEYSSNVLVGKMGQGNTDFSYFINHIQSKNIDFNKEIHILSDLQDYPFLNIPDESFNEWNLFVHEMNYIQNNLSITSVDIKNDIIALNRELQIDVEIQNNGIESAKNGLLVLNIDNLNVGQQQIALEPGESSIFSFFTVLTSPGIHMSNINLIYDNYSADNTYLFDLNIPENINIGLLGYSNDDFLFINNSLKAFNNNYKNLTITYPNQILSNENYLIDNDATFIFGYNYIEENNLESSLLESVENGSSIYIFPSSNERLDDINPDFFDFISMDVSKINFKEYSMKNHVEISSENIVNPDLINIFGDNTYVNLYKFFSFPGNKKSNILINGTSIWNSYPISNGSVDVLGFIPRLEWTNFPIQAQFLSWVDYCITRNQDNLDAAYEIGEQFNGSGEDYTIILPDLRKYEYRGVGDDLFKFNLRGRYLIEKRGESREIIVNPYSKELYFNRISNQKLIELFPNISIFNLNEKNYDKIEKARIGIELWKYFLYLVIILILIEMVISNQFFRRN